MTGTPDAKTQRRSRRPLVGGATTAFLVNATAAWLTWQILQGDRDTVNHSEFDSWLLVVGAAASATVIATVVALRSQRWFAAGLILGLVLAGVADVVGLFVDIVTSGGLA